MYNNWSIKIDVRTGKYTLVFNHFFSLNKLFPQMWQIATFSIRPFVRTSHNASTFSWSAVFAVAKKKRTNCVQNILFCTKKLPTSLNVCIYYCTCRAAHLCAGEWGPCTQVNQCSRHHHLQALSVLLNFHCRLHKLDKIAIEHTHIHTHNERQFTKSVSLDLFRWPIFQGVDTLASYALQIDR